MARDDYLPRCPRCSGTKGIAPLAGGRYRCKCGTLFDNDPDEGGCLHSNPERCLELKERLTRERKREGASRGHGRRRG